MDAQAEIDQIRADRKRIGGRMTKAERARIEVLESQLDGEEDAPSDANAVQEGAEVVEPAEEALQTAEEAPEEPPEGSDTTDGLEDAPEVPEGHATGVIFAPNLTLPDGSKASEGDLVVVPVDFLAAMIAAGRMGAEGDEMPREELVLGPTGAMPEPGEGEVVGRIVANNLTLPSGVNRPKNAAVAVPQEFFDAMVEAGRMEEI